MAAETEANARLEDDQGDRRRGLCVAAARQRSVGFRRVGRSLARWRNDSSPTTVEAGTGFYEQRFVGGEIQPALGEITVKKIDDGVAWGSVHWQYLEDMSKITPYEGTPLKLTKQLYVKKNTAKGPTLERGRGPRSKSATNWSCGSCCEPIATWNTFT